ncbi:hypothetical protein DFP72DRAFT_1043093 [Ephemerocybe angulata]|uniref:Uncharacterized protein n=1 Tax=Ephemerocybe angulata TaxID=980116 RepID=A0A8H6I5N8_9AGAR|nr:hypothetical protein DFP72DRAFT_1043093 [Tulosesus angulatus]
MAHAQPGPMILPGARNLDVDSIEYKSAGRDIHGPTINLTIASPPEILGRSLFEKIRSLLGLVSAHSGSNANEQSSEHEAEPPDARPSSRVPDLATTTPPSTSNRGAASGPAGNAQGLQSSESLRPSGSNSTNTRHSSEVDDATENEDFNASYTPELDPRPLEGLTTPQVYVYSMLGSGRGFACWKPQNQDSVGSPRRRIFPSISHSESTVGWRGIIPGDVGTYDAERGFRKMFNLWEDDEAIRGMARDIYHGIYTAPDDSEVKISEDDFRRGDTAAQSASAEVNDSGDDEVIQSFDFQAHPGLPQGALIALTSAADQLELLDLAGLHDHICSHAELLYKYANARRRIGSNESLYFVTGCIKTSGWAIAAWREPMVVPNDRLKLLKRMKTENSSATASSYRWTHRGTAEARVGNSSQQIKDQCLFLQGYKLNFSSAFRARMKRHILPVNVPPSRKPKGGGGGGSGFDEHNSDPPPGNPPPDTSGSGNGGGSDKNNSSGHFSSGGGENSGSNMEASENLSAPSPVDGVQLTPFPEINVPSERCDNGLHSTFTKFP